jgi:hypothetical protein
MFSSCAGYESARSRSYPAVMLSQIAIILHGEGLVDSLRFGVSSIAFCALGAGKIYQRPNAHATVKTHITKICNFQILVFWNISLSMDNIKTA